MSIGMDFGPLMPIEVNISATGTTAATAYLLRRAITVFGTVAPNAIALLPAPPSGNGVRLTVVNRGTTR